MISWWRHHMETFSALLALCAGNSPGTGEFPAQRPITQSFDVFCDLHLYKRLSKQSWGWWFETPSCPLWRHCNVSDNNLSDDSSMPAIFLKCFLLNETIWRSITVTTRLFVQQFVWANIKDHIKAPHHCPFVRRNWRVAAPHIQCTVTGAFPLHYSDVMMRAMASQITGVPIVCSTVCSCADQRKHQSSAPLAFVRGTSGDRWIPFTKGLGRGKMFPFDDASDEESISMACRQLPRGWGCHKGI